MILGGGGGGGFNRLKCWNDISILQGDNNTKSDN